MVVSFASRSGHFLHQIAFTGGKVKRPAVLVFLLSFGVATAALGQSNSGQGPAEGPAKGGEELQVWTSAGHSAINGTDHTGVWNAGLRYGMILTEPHGPRFLRGRLEYAVDAVPMYLIFQPSGVVYGAGVNPFAFKWLLDRRGRVAPYFEFGGGLLLTSRDVPPGVSNINFTSGSAIGANIGHGKTHWSVEVRWLHISDAGLTDDNPGINVIQVRAGIGWFHHKE
jgi:hypothetical protein